MKLKRVCCNPAFRRYDGALKKFLEPLLYFIIVMLVTDMTCCKRKDAKKRKKHGKTA